MTLDKAIKSKAEHRKTYKERGKPGEWDQSCRPHGGGRRYPCPYCENNRLFKTKRMNSRLKDLEE